MRGTRGPHSRVVCGHLVLAGNSYAGGLWLRITRPAGLRVWLVASGWTLTCHPIRWNTTLRQQRASEHTIAAYRDTWRLLLTFTTGRAGKPPSRLGLAYPRPVITRSRSAGVGSW